MTSNSQGNSAEAGHEYASFSKGDLGKGRGLKPGAISFDSEEEKQSSFTKFYSHSHVEGTSASPCNACQCIGHHHPGQIRKKNDDLSPTSQGDVHSFPTFAGVPFGTSLKQHRKLYEASRRGLSGSAQGVKRPGMKGEGDCNCTCIHASTERMLLADQLKLATEEVDILQNELEVCQSHLESKYRAIKILQHQAAIVNSRFQENEEKIRAMKEDLEKEVNSLQYEVDTKTSCLMQREETWSEKFNRVSLENSVLMASLQARTEEVGRLQADKLALIRERDELLARMDAQERLQYEQHWTTKNDQAYLKNTLTEQLAVLGACMCRGSNPEPCQCARIAAILTKENGNVRDELERLKQKLVESVLISDSFRKAFEEQLQCNSAILRDLNDSHKISKQGEKEKRPFWQRGRLNNSKVNSFNRPVQVQYGLSSLPVTRSFEEEEHEDNKQRTVGLQVCQPIPNSSNFCEDLLSEKSEALAHQRLVSKLLAQKTQDLEKAVKRAENLMKH